MKKFICYSLISILFFTGCQAETSETSEEPEKDVVIVCDIQSGLTVDEMTTFTYYVEGLGRIKPENIQFFVREGNTVEMHLSHGILSFDYNRYLSSPEDIIVIDEYEFSYEHQLISFLAEAREKYPDVENADVSVESTAGEDTFLYEVGWTWENNQKPFHQDVLVELVNEQGGLKWIIRNSSNEQKSSELQNN